MERLLGFVASMVIALFAAAFWITILRLIRGRLRDENGRIRILPGDALGWIVLLAFLAFAFVTASREFNEDTSRPPVMWEY